jgi:hypothetical protein
MSLLTTTLNPVAGGVSRQPVPHLGNSRKMNRNKKLIIGAVTLITIGYFSKPDRGGVGRCARIFSMPELHELQLSHSPFFEWELFESPKFRFKITATDFEKLSTQVSEDGYSPWTRGSLQFGSVLVGGSEEEDFIYCSKKTRSNHYYWSYSASERVIYAVSFRS